MDSKLTTVKRSAAARIARLDKDAALEILRRIRERGASIDQDAIRELTGGYASQSLNAWVTRKVGVKAGIIKNAG